MTSRVSMENLSPFKKQYMQGAKSYRDIPNNAQSSRKNSARKNSRSPSFNGNNIGMQQNMNVMNTYGNNNNNASSTNILRNSMKINNNILTNSSNTQHLNKKSMGNSQRSSSNLGDHRKLTNHSSAINSGHKSNNSISMPYNYNQNPPKKKNTKATNMTMTNNNSYSNIYKNIKGSLNNSKNVINDENVWQKTAHTEQSPRFNENIPQHSMRNNSSSNLHTEKKHMKGQSYSFYNKNKSNNNLTDLVDAISENQINIKKLAQENNFYNNNSNNNNNNNNNNSMTQNTTRLNSSNYRAQTEADERQVTDRLQTNYNLIQEKLLQRLTSANNSNNNTSQKQINRDKSAKHFSRESNSGNQMNHSMSNNQINRKQHNQSISIPQNVVPVQQTVDQDFTLTNCNNQKDMKFLVKIAQLEMANKQMKQQLSHKEREVMNIQQSYQQQIHITQELELKMQQIKLFQQQQNSVGNISNNFENKNNNSNFSQNNNNSEDFYEQLNEIKSMFMKKFKEQEKTIQSLKRENDLLIQKNQNQPQNNQQQQQPNISGVLRTLQLGNLCQNNVVNLYE